jgi:Domain of unknown function (DUF4249)
MKYFIPFVALFFIACNLTNEVEIELPEYERQPVVECYLEPGKPFRLLLTQSYSFFDPFGLDSNFLQKTLYQGATVTISYDGKTEVLQNQLFVDLVSRKIYNYTSPNTVPATVGTEFTLNIELPDGKGNISAKTAMLPKVPIDSIVVEWGPQIDTLARVLTYITEDVNAVNYYRRMLHYGSLDSLAEQDFLFSDRTSTEALVAFGTGYELAVGDTVFNTIFHIGKEYYDFNESVQLAIVGNLNPFAQPSSIKSNVSGTGKALGIFTSLVYDRDTTIIAK